LNAVNLCILKCSSNHRSKQNADRSSAGVEVATFPPGHSSLVIIRYIRFSSFSEIAPVESQN